MSFGDQDAQYPYTAPKDAVSPQLTPSVRRGHSGLGVASLILGVLAGLGGFLGMMIAGYLGSTGAINREPIAAMVVGLAMIVVVIMTSFAAGLAVGGLVQKQKSTTFAVVGLVVNGLLILGLLSLILVGMLLAPTARGF